MKCQMLFSGKKNKKNVTSLSSAKLAHGVVKLMDLCLYIYSKIPPRSLKIKTTSVSILHKSTAGHYQPVRIADGPITARCRFIKNASWDRY